MNIDFKSAELCSVLKINEQSSTSLIYPAPTFSFVTNISFFHPIFSTPRSELPTPKFHLEDVTAN